MLIMAMIFTSVNPVTTEAGTKKAALNKKSITLTITDKKNAPTTTIKVKNVKAKKVKWTSSNKKVASVKKTGKYSAKVTAKKAGKTKVTCKGNGKRLVCKVTVKDKRIVTYDNDDNDTDNTNAKTDTQKCDHNNLVAKWTVFEHEGDYPNTWMGTCYCGVFTSKEEWNQHFFELQMLGSFTKIAQDTGIHGKKAESASYAIGPDEKGMVHVKIRTKYIESYHCTKCGMDWSIKGYGPKEN